MSGIHAMLIGAGGDRVDVQGATVYAGSGSISTAEYQLRDTGIERSVNNSSVTDIGNYVEPVANAGQYEARLTVSTGTFAGAATGSWLALTTTRIWSVTQSVVGTNYATGTIEIRRTGSTTTIDSATVDLTAEVF